MTFGRAKCSLPKQTVLQHKPAKSCGQQTRSYEFPHSQSGKCLPKSSLFPKAKDWATQSPGGGDKPPSSLSTSSGVFATTQAPEAFVSTWISRPDGRFSDDGVSW